MSEIIFGLPEVVFLLWFSALFYVAAIILFLAPLFREKNELMFSFFAFLTGMAFFHIFLGLGLYLNNMIFIHMGSFSALTGAAYTLKFPLTAISPAKRKPLFYLALAAAWLIVVWLLIRPHETKTMLLAVLGYMILASGLIAGPYILWRGIKSKETWMKIKCVGGGAGLFICCLLADVLVLLGGVSVLGEFLMVFAPIVLISATYLGRYVQRNY